MDYLNWFSPYLSFIFMHVYYIIFLCFCVFLCLYSQSSEYFFVCYFSFQTNCDFLSHVIYAIYLVKVMSVLFSFCIKSRGIRWEMQSHIPRSVAKLIPDWTHVLLRFL